MRLHRVIERYLFVTETTQKDFMTELGWNPATTSRFLSSGKVSSRHLATLLRWLLEPEGKEDDGTTA